MPFTDQELQELVTILNQHPHGIDKRIPPLLQMDGLDIHAEGPLLYPCSGSDVTFPTRLLLNIDELVLVDEHLMFNAGFEDIRHDLSETGKATSFKSGFGLLGEGYDDTSVHSILQRANEDKEFNFNSQAIGAILLLRLRKLCGMELTSIKEDLPGLVYTIKGNVEGKEKTVHYVSHFFGKLTPAYNWLTSQNFQFQTLFVKAFSASIGQRIIDRQVFAQIHTLLRPSIIASKAITVISDASNGYTLNDGLPHLLDPTTIIKRANTSYPFGYDDCMVVADSHAIYQDYPEALVTEMQRKQAEAHRREEEKRARQCALEHKLSVFPTLSPDDKWASLIESGDISVDNETLIIPIHNQGIYPRQMTSMTIDEILRVSRKHNCTALTIRCDKGYGSHLYQSLVIEIAKQLDSVGSHLTTLRISAPLNDEICFLSQYAIRVAEAIASHGKHLSKLDIVANDKGALAFKDAVLELSKDGTLKEASIRPINGWRPETTATISDAMALISKSHSLQASSRSSSSLWPAGLAKPEDETSQEPKVGLALA